MAAARSLALTAASSSVDARGWMASATAAVAIHAALIALLYARATIEPDAPAAAPAAAMVAELAPLPSAPPSIPSDAAPGPDQVEQHVQPLTEARPVPFDPPPDTTGNPPPEALAKRVEQLRPQPQPERPPADATTAPPAAPAAKAEVAKAPVQSAPSAGGADAQSWEGRLLAHLERHKRYPFRAQALRQQDTIYVRFVMARDGKVLEWRIMRSAHHALLDQEVDGLLKRASPLPAMPTGMNGDTPTIAMMVPIVFHLR